jgi:ABC-type bacteriocin/lantibiotic exporter with double-glycine peptidase domain
MNYNNNFITLIKTSTVWPSKGTIIFDNVCLRYGESSSMILKNLSFTIQGGFFFFLYYFSIKLCILRY